MNPDFSFEKKYWEQGYTVIGIDEVGRGCLAGPIAVGAVCFDPKTTVEFAPYTIRDSKKLSAKKRETLHRAIRKSSLISDIGFVDVDHINEHGINSALTAAINLVVQKCLLRLCDCKIVLLIDGRTIDDIPYNRNITPRFIISGDNKSISVACAAILAKVERDAYMDIIGRSNDAYLWQKNKGYGTKEHRVAIQQFGLTPHHRTLFVRKVLSESEPIKNHI